MADTRFYRPRGPFTLSHLAEVASAELYDEEDAERLIYDVAPLQTATPQHISFFSNRKYAQSFSYSKAGACVIEEGHIDLAPEGMALLISDDAYRSYALIAAAFYPDEVADTSIHPTALVPKSAQIGKGVAMGPSVVIGEEVVIGDGCVIGAGTVIERGVVLGKNCRIGSSVSIRYTIIGDNAIIHPGVRIGQDGFGFAQDRGRHVKVPQLGRVIIGNNVEIGANTCIDRGAGPDTLIGDECKIDNLVQIGHNVALGRGCIIVAQVGIAGSTTVGDYVVIGGQAGISGHLYIGAGAKIAAQSGVMRDIAPKEVVGGAPAVPIKQWHRQTVALKYLTQKNEDE